MGQQWIAREWYDVDWYVTERWRDVSDRVSALALGIDRLSEDDVPLVAALVKRLAPPAPPGPCGQLFPGGGPLPA